MRKLTQRPRPAPSAKAARTPRRDPLTRMARFCEFLALGLVAASLFLKFANARHPTNAPAISLDNFPGLQKAAVIAVHTRTPWVTLALAGLVVAVIAYRKRHAPTPSKLVRLAPLVILVVLALHVAAQAYLQSQGSLNIEIHSAAPAGLQSALSTLPGVSAITISRMLVPEGTAQQWSFLFASDILFSIPILFAWFLSFAPRRAPQSMPAHPS